LRRFRFPERVPRPVATASLAKRPFVGPR
jgi:hypothetical protein